MPGGKGFRNMKNLKHTPGPWWNSGLEIGTAPMMAIKTTKADGASYEESKANARLIAAAPKMLEILIRDTVYLINSLPALQMVNDFRSVIQEKIDSPYTEPIPLESWVNLKTKIETIERATGLPIEEVPN